VLVIVSVAIVLRALPLTAAQPYLNYVDEGHVLERSAHMIDGRTPTRAGTATQHSLLGRPRSPRSRGTLWAARTRTGVPV